MPMLSPTGTGTFSQAVTFPSATVERQSPPHFESFAIPLSGMEPCGEM